MKKFILALLICAGAVHAQSLIVISGSKTVAAPGTVATPTFSPVAGTYSSTQTVTISTTTPLAVLCYTTDGTTPTEVSHLCSGGTTSTYSTPITVSTTQTVKAIGTLATYTDSAVASATYTISATPAFTNHWPLWSGANCTGGVTNGNPIGTAVDTAGSNNLSQSNASEKPTCSTNSINSLAAGIYWLADPTLLSFGSTMCQSGCNMTWVAVVDPSSNIGTYTLPIVGPAYGSDAGFEWKFNTSDKQELDSAVTTVIATGTTVYNANTWVAVFAQYNESTGAYTIGHCSAGSTVTEVSGTNPVSFSNPIGAVGFSGGGEGGFDGKISDLFYFNSATTANVCSWIYTTYGL